jgi:deferrochelatase/peroxidase EfeB
VSIKLYQIAPEWENVMKVLEEGCGELTPEIEAAMNELMSTSKEKLESAAYALRNLKIHAELAKAQAGVFQEQMDACMAVSKSFAAAAERLGDMMAPALDVTGKIKTLAGTLYTQQRTTYAFELKPGVPFGMLDEKLWRQAAPELVKTELNKLATAGTLPDEILALATTKTTTVLKAPTAKKDTAETPAA